MQEQLLSLAKAAREQSLYSQEMFYPSHLFVPQKYQEVMSNKKHSSDSPVHADSFSDLEHEAVIVTGSADPFSLHVTYKQPLPGHEDAVAICVSCCNLTDVPLNGFEIHIRPLSAVKCIDGSNDLKLRLMQGGNASGSLPCFGVFKSEKRFQVQTFAQTSFFFQVVFNEVDSSSASGDDQPQVIPIRLSPSEKFVLHFDALLRSPKHQFATGVFFQHTWQSAEASCLFPIESVLHSESTEKLLSFCQCLVKRCSIRVAIIQDLLIDTPIQIHIAFLTETRWEQFIAASVTLTASFDATADGSGMRTRWSGVLEIRSSSANIREFVETPRDALHVFCGRQHLQIASDPSNRMMVTDPHTEGASRTIPAGMQSASESASNPFYTGAMVSSAMAFPGMDFTASGGGDRGISKNDSTWALSPFDNPFDAPEQLRPASSATFNDPWGTGNMPNARHGAADRTADRRLSSAHGSTGRTDTVDARGGGFAASAAAAVDAQDDPETKVYRPLLFHSSGYASSELFRDTYEMRTRMQEKRLAAKTTSPSSALLAVEDSDSDGDGENGEMVHARTKKKPRQPHDDGGMIHARIRLETLSSRAATTVLWITYLAFCVAIAMPYLQSQGFLGTVVTLPGGLCNTSERLLLHTEEPCIIVDKKKGVARWSGLVNNVSWYAGSIELALDISEVINSTAPASLQEGDEGNELQQMDVLWHNWRPHASTLDGQVSLELMDQSFALQYDVFLYGVDVETTPVTKTLIVAERNQSVWVHCPSEACDKVRLLDISQDFEERDGGGYGSYLVVVVFKGVYPNAFGKKVSYDFSYTKPALHVSELIVRTLFLVVSLFALPCWLIAVLNYHGSWHEILSVQKWVFALGFVLMLWQNPIYAVSELSKTVSLRTRFVAEMCESFAEAFFYVFWLNLLDRHGRAVRKSTLIPKVVFGVALLAVDVGMAVIRMPSLFSSASNRHHNGTAHSSMLAKHEGELYTALGFVRIAMLVVWLVWIARIGWQTGVYLRQLPYMSTRFQQLSYRFLSLETILILIYVMVLSGVQVFFLLQTWYLMGYEPFIQSAVHTFAKSHSGRPSLGKLIFLSVYVYLVMFVHLPPESGDSMGLLATTAYHVEEKPRVDHYGFLTPDSHLFCVETATWLLEIAWQAYFDPPGRPSPSGYGELDLEPYGFDLVTHLRSSLTDTHVVVALNQDRTRLVVAFRGTTSRENWKSNLRFHQKVLWVKSRGRWRQRTCMEATKDFLSKIPLLNMALPRVHSGFWKAYASVRDELKEVTRLILDENPGVTVYVTGHSMGGALAILAAYDLAVNFSMKVNMYNFGGPRVGNPSFCRHYNKCVATSYRVVMDGDIVPGVPKFWGLYQHVGTEIAIDLEGNLIVDPSFVERHLHVSSKTKVATHPSSVYRASLTKCLENLITS
ncbi:hypothetical protein FI667_g6455, partial [Globisporangium splendens]